METTSNISSAWTPATNLGHEIGNLLQVHGTRLWVIGKLLREMRPMGLSFAVFPGFLFHVGISSKFVRDACRGFRIFWCRYFSLFRSRPYIGLACGRWG